jgi:hypothetical protein
LKPLKILLLLLPAFLFSCVKEVHINLNTGAPKLVVEGQIETGGFPFVLLTKSIGYFSTVDLSVLEKSFVHGAVVKVSDGIDTIQLKEYAVDTGANDTNKFYAYSIDTTDAKSLMFRGVAERVYYLRIESEGKVYEATTKIPNVKPIDTMWFRKPSGRAPIAASMIMYVRYKDPDTLGNYGRYFTKENHAPFLPGFNSTFDDEIINGQRLDSLHLFAGSNHESKRNIDSMGFFFMGDTVTLKWCATDKGVFNFFRTFEFATDGVGNPFAAPTSVMSNIKGGALGVWAGYGSSYTKAIVPVQ